MLTKLEISPHTLSGISLGGVYTSILVPELDALFDAGIAPRSFVGAKNLFISHSHADHLGALPALLGQRGLAHLPAPRTFVPQEILQDVVEGIAAFNRGQARRIDFSCVGMLPGEEHQLRGDLWVHAFRTLHTVPSLGYLLFRKVPKLRAEFLDMRPEEIAAKRRAGEELFDVEERGEVTYLTDTLIDVLDENPQLYQANTMILECTFLDQQKSVEETRVKGHIHLNEIIARADRFQNRNIVLMHFSQLYSPSRVRQLLREALPESLQGRIRVLAPKNGSWPG